MPAGRSPRQARTSGSAAMASSRPASSVVRGTIESTSRYSAGAWSLPPIGPRPSRLGTPSPAVVLASDAPPVEASATSKPSDLRHALGVLDQAAAALELLHRPPARHRLEVDGHVGDLGRLGDRADGRFGRLERVARRRPDVDLERARLGDHVGPRAAEDAPDIDGHVRPATVEVVQLADDAGRLEDRAATLLGLDAGVRRPAVDDDAQVEDPLARRDDVAVRPRAFEHERDVGVGGGSLDVRGRGRRADLLVGVGDEDQPLERQAAAFGDDRLERVETGQQPRLHVGDARAVGDPVLDAERALGRGPRIEDRVHVADQQGPRAARPALERRDDRVAEPAGRVRPDLDRGAQLGQERRRPSGPTSLTPSRV